MLKNDYFVQLKALFFAKGISNRQSNHLIEELRDHLALKMAEFQAQGKNPADSERLALEVVGTPEAIAEKAAANLQGGWLMRFAWLLCGGGFFLAGLLAMFAIMLAGYFFSGMYSYYHGSTSRVSLPVVLVEVILFNWLPLLLGMAGLALLIRFSSIGWKSIFFIAVALGMAVSIAEIRFAITPIAESDRLCFMDIYFNFVIRQISCRANRWPDLCLPFLPSNYWHRSECAFLHATFSLV